MSYCRFSSDNWKSDLYCFEDDVIGGWTTHVARRRRVGIIPYDQFEDFITGKIDTDTYMKLHKIHMDAVEAAQVVDIDHPLAGKSFNDPSLDAFRARVVMLREAGFHVPGDVIDQIDEEIAAAQGKTP